MKRLFFLLLLSTPLLATEYRPWFSPLWEFQGRASYFYNRVPKQDPIPSSNNHTVRFGLELTPWPYWSGEVELLMSRSTDIPFSYEALITTVRYQWYDDIEGDPLALATGITLSFPDARYTRSFYYLYPGEVNGELHLTVGKEWGCPSRWWIRAWALGGWGIANQGNSWLHGICALEIHPFCFEAGLFTEAYYGFGSDTLEQFDGYRSVAYRTVDVGGYIRFCSLTLKGWYTGYAQNFVEHDWGAGFTIWIPFGL